MAKHKKRRRSAPGRAIDLGIAMIKAEGQVGEVTASDVEDCARGAVLFVNGCCPAGESISSPGGVTKAIGAHFGIHAWD